MKFLEVLSLALKSNENDYARKRKTDGNENGLTILRQETPVVMDVDLLARRSLNPMT